MAQEWSLAGLGVLVLGFALRWPPLLVVVLAALTSGLLSGLSPWQMLGAFGRAFADNRYISVIWLVLPVIGLLEANGLRERAGQMVAQFRQASAGRLLLIYFVLRQFSAALGQTKLGGHPQMVRPLLAPMVEAAAQRRHGPLPPLWRWRLRAHAAAVDNIALFFGEDIFIAIASVLLIQGFLQQNGLVVEPLTISLWAIPTAIAALLVHGARLLWLDRRLRMALGTPGSRGADA